MKKDINRTPQEAITNLEQSLEIFPSQQLAFFEISWMGIKF